MEVRVFFFRGKKGDIIGHSEDGKIVFIDRKSTLIPNDGEAWFARVVAETRSGHKIVSPVERVSDRQKREAAAMTSEAVSCARRWANGDPDRLEFVKKFNDDTILYYYKNGVDFLQRSLSDAFDLWMKTQKRVRKSADFIHEVISAIEPGPETEPPKAPEKPECDRPGLVPLFNREEGGVFRRYAYHPFENVFYVTGVSDSPYKGDLKVSKSLRRPVEITTTQETLDWDAFGYPTDSVEIMKKKIHDARERALIWMDYEAKLEDYKKAKAQWLSGSVRNQLWHFNWTVEDGKVYVPGEEGLVEVHPTSWEDVHELLDVQRRRGGVI